jgi:hypothetical protein
MLRRKTTPQSLAANRANTKLSTGPRSARGKRHSSLNSLQHGILAARPVFHSDQEKARFEQIRTSLLADTAPVGILEGLLAEDIVNLSWTLILATDWAFLEWNHLIASGQVLDQLLQKTTFPAEFRTELADHWSALELEVRTSDNNTEAERKADQGTLLVENTSMRSSEGHLKGESKQKTGVCTTDVRFARSLDLAKRYQAQIRANLHRAIRELRNLQGDAERQASKRAVRTATRK